MLSGRTLHLMLLDISLQGGTHGLDLARQIRASEQHARLPIIAVTAHAFDQDRINCLEAGCTAYLRKPVEISLLFQTIKAVLGDEG